MLLWIVGVLLDFSVCVISVSQPSTITVAASEVDYPAPVDATVMYVAVEDIPTNASLIQECDSAKATRRGRRYDDDDDVPEKKQNWDVDDLFTQSQADRREAMVDTDSDSDWEVRCDPLWWLTAVD